MYDNRNAVKAKRHTVRFNKEGDEVIRLLANLADLEPAVLIRELSMEAAKQKVREGLLENVEDETAKRFLMRRLA